LCTVTLIGCCSNWFTSARCIAGFVFAAKWSDGQGDALASSTGRLDYIGAHGEIWEVILTGGDP
jgi:hypothetical protein